MTNNQPWQAIVNVNNLPKVISTDNNLNESAQTTTTHKKAKSYLKVVTPKRYSFDDNGGGYEGL